MSEYESVKRISQQRMGSQDLSNYEPVKKSRKSSG